MNKFYKYLLLGIVLFAIAGCDGAMMGKKKDSTPGDELEPADIGSVDEFAMNSAPDSIEYFSGIVGDSILFEVDSSVISPEYEIVLMDQVAWVLTYPGYSITIEGHADERGTREYNLALGARRAESVRNFMILQGVDLENIDSVSYGKERPYAACSEESCWSQNRRGVTILTGEPQS